jgi:hypothetical protein
LIRQSSERIAKRFGAAKLTIIEMVIPPEKPGPENEDCGDDPWRATQCR